MKLQLIKTIEVEATRPFNFDATFHKPDHFTSGDNYWEPGIRWQTMCWRGKQLGLKFTNNSTANRPGILVNIYYNKPLAEDFISSLINEITYRFNLDLDLSDFNKTFRNEKILGPIVKRWKGMRPGHPGSLYEYIIIGILLQNATIRRSINMFQSLLEQYGKLLEFDNKKLLKYFERYGEYKQLAVHYIWEDVWWKRKNEHIPWLEELIRI